MKKQLNPDWENSCLLISATVLGASFIIGVLLIISEVIILILS